MKGEVKRENMEGAGKARREWMNWDGEKMIEGEGTTGEGKEGGEELRDKRWKRR